MLRSRQQAQPQGLPVDGLDAFQRNWIGLFEVLPRYRPSARFWREDGIAMALTGVPIATFNGVLLPDEHSLTLRRFDHFAEPFRTAGVPFSFQVCSRSERPACDPLFRSQGLTDIFVDPVMICSGPLAVTRRNPDVVVRAVSQPEDRRHFQRIVIEGFDLPPGVTEDFFEQLLAIQEAHQMIALLDEKPVGAGLLLYLAGVASIFNVATLPAYRKRGVATALMAALHSQALADGYPATVLTSSEMGLLLYEHLGYRRVGYQSGYAPVGMS
jgi:N-acetylglutamate synthase